MHNVLSSYYAFNKCLFSFYVITADEVHDRATWRRMSSTPHKSVTR